jgi:hypothetical protein
MHELGDDEIRSRGCPRGAQARSNYDGLLDMEVKIDDRGKTVAPNQAVSSNRTDSRAG